ncbi:ATP-binding cassette domain-containing protein [Mesorhizobium sp. 8]|uniref:ATP-binding cassette domain-containing protein n=1 Tax=Mesorhizobium sp. 8 TaxID=2584466 RepID=UPI00111FB71D|nr:ATP-binding cassette domain-containing protein [Mesorhizobium sp. 8]QDC01645.1 ATP-binding cassette domain-containing protein [Mesorhizobium sp. 8]
MSETGTGEPLLRLRNIEKHFGAVEALAGVDFDVPAGQVTALVGDNGAGKSVLVKTIAGIHEADGGEIFWEGKPVHVRSPRDSAALGIEVVYQDLALCDNLDVVQNMFLGRERVRNGLLDEDSMEKAAADTLAGLHVRTVRSVRQKVVSLSGGQRQSIAVAKAVMWNSRLVILDEPTAALGVAQTRQVLALVRRLADQGLAVVMISHNLNDVFAVADRIAVLRLGRMVGAGPVSQFDSSTVVDLMTMGRSERRAALGKREAGATPEAISAETPLERDAMPPVNGEDASERVETLIPTGTQSFGDYMHAAWSKIRAGQSGILPVVLGLILISAIFQSQNANFLSPGNLVNLLVQGSVFMLIGMGEVFVLLLAEIDLSLGFVAGIGGVVVTELVQPDAGWPWWVAIAAALLVTAFIGFVQGTLITRLRLPSFVVTLGGLLGFQGLMILLLGTGGTIPIPDDTINNLANGTLSNAAGWTLTIAVVAIFAAITTIRHRQRQKSGLITPPAGLTVVKIAAATVAGVVIVLICNTQRGVPAFPFSGMPWVVPIVLGVLFVWSVLLTRTRFGRYIYAIGGNAEAARRAGIGLGWSRTAGFTLAGLTAGIGGIVYASRLRSMSTSFDGGTIVLYVVATAVIGGTSLFGGRGHPLHAVLGGIVIAAIVNGMALLGLSAAVQLIATALVLIAAITVDVVVRQRGETAR